MNLRDSLSNILQAAVERGRTAAAAGQVASYIPELQRADPAHVAVAIETLDGESVSAGDCQQRFTLQSVSKVFSLACVLRGGDDALFDSVSQEPSGDAFHSIVRLEEEGGRPRNPLINAGAIVVSSRLDGRTPTERQATFQRFLADATGDAADAFALDEAVYLSECRTGSRNRALANYMAHYGILESPTEAADTYFRQCSLTVNTRQLARAGLFLANGGVIPNGGRRILSSSDNHTVLALMATCGLYDEVGHFAVRVGLPAKSGVSGGVLAIVPGKMAIACYGPALGNKGNSLASMMILEELVNELQLSVFGPK